LRYLLFVVIVEGSSVEDDAIEPLQTNKRKRSLSIGLLDKVVKRRDSVSIFIKIEVRIDYQFLTNKIGYYMNMGILEVDIRFAFSQ
jgi:hypothetical protein